MTLDAAELTRREIEVLQALISHGTAKRAARGLNISPRTVEHYSRRAREKMGVHSNLQVVAIAVRNGIA